jgi:hypothetical protein
MDKIIEGIIGPYLMERASNTYKSTVAFTNGDNKLAVMINEHVLNVRISLFGEAYSKTYNLSDPNVVETVRDDIGRFLKPDCYWMRQDDGDYGDECAAC